MRSYSAYAPPLLLVLASYLALGCDEEGRDDEPPFTMQLESTSLDASSRAADVRVASSDAGADASPGNASPACPAYCSDIQSICLGDNRQFGDAAACERACAGYPTDGAANAMRGNSLQCRVNHIQVNILQKHQPPATHCPHAGPTGGGACK